MSEEKDALAISRRTVIAGAAAVPLAALTVSAQPAPTPAALSADQRKILEAFLERLCPKDELGPGAVECGAADYIDIQLAGYLAPEKMTFTDGLAALDKFAQSSQSAAFTELPPEKQDAVLTAIESGRDRQLRAFFNRARRLMLEGMFGDPHYGGNKNFAGWDLIKYPGPRPFSTPAEQKMGVPIKPYHKSAWGMEHNGH
ncbi:MAG TPA: gluconate 2-dehydrogenase subunit 3 family protein [Bryobacteraceae bacterium]|nr:gluconate 2-dehydrogenase subunit 3 family protein [Bryobacteraceae bacterium]